MTKLKKNLGFTLAEMLISIVIILLVVLMITSIFTLSQRSMRQANNKAELIQNSRVALDLMSREIRQAKKIISELPTSNINALHEITFEDGHDISEIHYINYSLQGNEVYRRVYIYFFDTNPDIYVHYNDVDAFGPPESMVIDEKVVGEYFDDLIFYGNGNINIEMIMKKDNTEIFLKSVINPRNT